jgi:sulfatase maturation enzyme AslB (radical SAM superfamily)
MQKCSGCKVVWYCGPVCQKKDWTEEGETSHKLQCPRIKEQRELYTKRKKEEAEQEMVEIVVRIKRENMLRGDGASSSHQG